MPLHFSLMSPASVILPAQSQPKSEQKRRNDADEHPRIAGPAEALHAFAFLPILAGSTTSFSLDRLGRREIR
jgi:hypothetical protein